MPWGPLTWSLTLHSAPKEPRNVHFAVAAEGEFTPRSSSEGCLVGEINGFRWYHVDDPQVQA